jgi:hypothetical protein
LSNNRYKHGRRIYPEQDRIYDMLAVVPGVAWGNSVLHAWDIGKRCSYGLLEATGLGCCKMRSDLFPFSTFFISTFSYYHYDDLFGECFESGYKLEDVFLVPALSRSRSCPSPVSYHVPVLSRSWSYPGPISVRTGKFWPQDYLADLYLNHFYISLELKKPLCKLLSSFETSSLKTWPKEHY